jgi:acylpyruvate hydrolase
VKLTTYQNGQARLGAVLSDGSVLDLAAYWPVAGTGPVPAGILELLRSGQSRLSGTRAVVDAAEERLAGGDLPVYDADSLRYLPPWRPGRVYAIGLNYRSHAEEQGAKIPKAPVVFTKAISALTAHDSPIVAPPTTEALDYEAELAVVIGRTCQNVDVSEAMRHVAGYTCLNDVSARDLQQTDRQWFRSKSYPTFCPLGRDLVTADEIPVVEDVVVSCRVGAELRQSAPVGDLIFAVPELIAFLSSFTTLEAGDVIATGTPGGVGFAMDPPRFLNNGDVVTVQASGVTTLRNTVAAS